MILRGFGLGTSFIWSCWQTLRNNSPTDLVWWGALKSKLGVWKPCCRRKRREGSEYEAQGKVTERYGDKRFDSHKKALQGIQQTTIRSVQTLAGNCIELSEGLRRMKKPMHRSLITAIRLWLVPALLCWLQSFAGCHKDLHWSLSAYIQRGYSIRMCCSRLCFWYTPQVVYRAYLQASQYDHLGQLEKCPR